MLRLYILKETVQTRKLHVSEGHSARSASSDGVYSVDATDADTNADVDAVNHRTTSRKRIGAIAVLLLALLPCRGLSDLLPLRRVVFTSTRYVTGIVAASDNTLWVSTRGGILRRSAEGVWRKFTRKDGLPAHESPLGAPRKRRNLLAVFPEDEARCRTTTGRSRRVFPRLKMRALNAR